MKRSKDAIRQALARERSRVTQLDRARAEAVGRIELHRLAEIPEAEERLILATGRYIGEGFDDARLDTLFLALPIS